MSHQDNLGPLDPAAEEIIRRWVRPLAGRDRLTSQDLEDLEQLLRLKLLQCPSPPDDDPARHQQVLRTIVARTIGNFLRDRKAAKRDFRRLRSLHVLVDEDCRRIELGQTLGQDAHDTRLRRDRRDDQEQAELALDVAESLANLPDELRAVAERLLHAPIAEVARELGLRPSTLYGLVHRLRRRFRRAGLDEYL